MGCIKLASMYVGFVRTTNILFWPYSSSIAFSCARFKYVYCCTVYVVHVFRCINKVLIYMLTSTDAVDAPRDKMLYLQAKLFSDKVSCFLNDAIITYSHSVSGFVSTSVAVVKPFIAIFPFSSSILRIAVFYWIQRLTKSREKCGKRFCKSNYKFSTSFWIKCSKIISTT